MADSSKKMSLMGLTTIVAVNMMGSGIIMLPANMAQIGAVSLLSWAITAVGSMAIAYSFAQCGLFCSRSGGMSAYTEEAHGKSGFFMASFLYYLSLAVRCVCAGLELLMGKGRVIDQFPAVMGSEDFQEAFRPLKTPYAFMLVGVAPPELFAKAQAAGKPFPYSNHNPDFFVDLAAIPIGAEVNAVAVLSVLAKKP